MTIPSALLPSALFGRIVTAALLMLVLAIAAVTTLADTQGRARTQTLRGSVESNGTGLPSYEVSLFVSYAGGAPNGSVIGTATTEDTGEFTIQYQLPLTLPSGQRPIFFVMAEDGPAMLATVFGTDPTHLSKVVVNERTTVATGVAFAQFIDGRQIHGNTYGMINAVKMAANMANRKTGGAGDVLSKTPNGTETSTYPTFNSMANVVASCVAAPKTCAALFKSTTPPGGTAPSTVLQAVANMTKYPSNNLDDLFALSFVKKAYEPALASNNKPASWLLFIKFTGGFYSERDAENLMNGPGNIAIDEQGFARINNNYVPQPAGKYECAGLRLMKFFPWGQSFPNSPYFGGGLNGAGFGITLDPRGDVWVGNFGFEAPACADGTVPPNPAEKIPATHNSVSVFRPDGQAKSPAAGYTNGRIWWPQATVSDTKGNIWIANCGNDTVTLIPRGNVQRARNFTLPGTIASPPNGEIKPPQSPNLKPFGVAIDPKGRAWVTGNKAHKVYIVSPDGTVETPNTKGLVSWPMGIAGDSKGNMWVSSSAVVNVPCVDPVKIRLGGGRPSVVLFPADGEPYNGKPQQFIGGGLTIPWGIVVDGNDTVWVFNFGYTLGEFVERSVEEGLEWPNTGLSHFCGVDTAKCPLGSNTVGAPISPDTGYTSDALERVTGGGIDPSGNVWLTNNWMVFGPLHLSNPGGNSIVIVPGAAAPLKTPLIGPPRSFSKSPDQAKK